MKLIAVTILILLSFYFVSGKNRLTEYNIKENVQTSTIKINGDSEIKIVDGYSNINTIESMLANFKGVPVFIDLWATWCEPCIEEMKHNDSLYKFLSKNGIKILYVSIDKDEKDSTWKSMLYSHKLNGYHIRANQNLLNDFTNLIWGETGGYSIPHYLLFDKNKNLVNKEALAPSTGVKLYQQIVSEIINLPIK